VAVGAVANKESDYTEDDVKQLEAFLSHAQIIAEQKRAQQVLKESEERFRFFVETANEGVWSMDGQFRTTFVNRKMAEMLGFSPEEMLGRTVDSFMFEEDSLDHEARMAKRQLGRNDSYERRFRRKDGEEVWTVVSATAMVDENREFQGSFAMFTDITERKLSEDKLRKSEERYRNLFENMIEGFAFRKMLYDDYGRPADYVFLNVNTAFEHITGLTNVVGQRATDVLPGIKDAHPELFEIYGEVAMTGRAKRFEFYMEPLKSWFDVSAHSPERDYFVTVVENITERKHMEEALRDSEATLRTVLQAAPIGIGLVTNRIFGWTNERLSQMTGYSAYDLLGRNAGILYESDEEFNRVGTAKYEQIKVRGIGEVETRWKRKDGALIDILLSSSSIVPGDLSKGVVFSATDITQRKKTEQALRDSEQRHRIVADFTYDWEYWVDAEGNFLYVSPSCERISGYSAEEFISDPDLMNRITHPDDRAKMLDHYHKERKVISPAVDTMDFRIIRRDGAIRWIAHVSQPVYGQEGQAFGRRGSNRDITDRKLAELSLKESGEFLNTILNAVPVPLFYKDTDCRYIGFNKSYEEFYGKTQQELVGKSVFDIAPRDLAEIYHAKDLELFDNPGAQVYDSQVKDARGAVHDVVFHKSTFLDLQGHVRGLIGVILDITERKQAENALWLSESQSNAILNGITANIGFLNDKLEILWVNKAAAASVGRLPDQMIGATCHSLWADPERPCENCPALKAFKTKKSEEAIITMANGRIWNSRAEPVFDHGGNLLGVVELGQDITEYRRLTQQEKQLSTAIAQSAEAVIITDANGIIQYVNPAQEILSGYSSDELIGQTPNVLNSDFHHGNFYEQIWDTIGVGKAWSGRFVNKKKDGTEYHEDATISPIYDHSRNLTNFVAVKHDVTKQVTLQEQLFQAQKMEAIGTLAGGFAHDFNNKLQVIDGYVDLMLFDKDLPETLKQDMRIIKQAVDSSAELIKGMMVFSRKTPIELQTIDLNKLVAQTGSMLARSISKIIEIDLLLAEDLWPIKAAPNQIDQILMNLAVNARDAMPDGGRLTIGTKNIVLDEEYYSFDPLVKPGRYVLTYIPTEKFKKIRITY
jgi:PAS domain S-box-containing protein